MAWECHFTFCNLELKMRKIPKKWTEPILILIAGLVLTIKARNQKGLFEITDTEQMIIVFLFAFFVFLFRSYQEKNKKEKEQKR